MRAPYDDLSHRPLLLDPVERPMAWGREVWLNGTQEEGPARIFGSEITLAELLRERPEALGVWPRLLFGDGLPIFTKFLCTNFPPLVHAGFRLPVERGEFLSWLGREQALLRPFLAALRAPDEPAFKLFQAAYEVWAVAEALDGWRSEDAGPGEAFEAAVSPLLAPGFARELPGWLLELRANRARIVETLNEVDLRAVAGNLLLMQAGVPHAIFGLSHQTHPIDRSKAELEVLYGRLETLGRSGAPTEEMAEAVRRADLPALRSQNAGPPKNEAWLPLLIDGELLLVEPQQTSNATYSFADFYTPFTWKGRPAFRKGDPVSGLGAGDLEKCTRELDFSVTPMSDILRAPVPEEASPAAVEAQAFLFVDDPAAWPFFTAREVRLDGTPGHAARWPGKLPGGAFQQVAVVQGEVRIEGSWGAPLPLSPRCPAFLPATLGGGYTLSADGPARVLLFGVPVPGARRARQDQTTRRRP